MAMVYRGLYHHYTQAFHRCEADEPAAYLAAHTKRLGLLKQKRKNRPSPAALLHVTLAQKS